MIRAAVIVLALRLRRPSALPCPLLMDDAALPPWDGIGPGFWSCGDGTTVMTCTYCGTEEHRSIRCPSGRRTDYIAAAVYLAWAVVGTVLIAALSGCSVTVAPDTLCQLPRPVAALNDTDVTRARQAKAAKAWDSQCTVRGWLTR